MGFAKEQNDVIFITVSLTPSLQRFFNTHVSGASEVNTMLLLDCIDLVSSSVDSHVSIRKTQVSIYTVGEQKTFLSSRKILSIVIMWYWLQCC